MDGLSGNASARTGEDFFVITAAGACKGRLRDGDFVQLDTSGRKIWGDKKASSEWRLHAALYEAFPEIRAVLHTHPVNLQALERATNAKPSVAADFLPSWLQESEIWQKRFAVAEEAPLGSVAVGENAASALRSLSAPFPRAVWLPRHGLCAAGAKIDDALAIADELEHMAKVKIARLAVRQ